MLPVGELALAILNNALPSVIEAEGVNDIACPGLAALPTY